MPKEQQIKFIDKTKKNELETGPLFRALQQMAKELDSDSNNELLQNENPRKRAKRVRIIAPVEQLDSDVNQKLQSLYSSGVGCYDIARKHVELHCNQEANIVRERICRLADQYKGDIETTLKTKDDLGNHCTIKCNF